MYLHIILRYLRISASLGEKSKRDSKKCKQVRKQTGNIGVGWLENNCS